MLNSMNIFPIEEGWLEDGVSTVLREEAIPQVGDTTSEMMNFNFLFVQSSNLSAGFPCL